MALTAVFGAHLAGCGPEWAYVSSAACGEIDFLSRAVPIEDALHDPALTDEDREKLAFIVRARDFAREVVGLNAAASYRTFVNLGGRPLAWNLSASRKDAIEPYIWHLPLVGSFTYLGFFDFDRAVAERDRLVGLGYDTMIYEVDAFSTLGLLPDPVASTMLKRPLAGLADTIMHELAHATIWRPGDPAFSESLATFIGRTAGPEFLVLEFGAQSEVVLRAIRDQEDTDRFDGFLMELTAELQALYASGASYEDKLRRREEIIAEAQARFENQIRPLMHYPETYGYVATFPFNNAFLLVNMRYGTDLDVFARVHELTGRSWPASLELFRQAAAAPDPFGFLRGLAAGGS